MIVDCFAGGGGASLGIEMALGRSPDVAVNHDAEAIAVHAHNHPDTIHYQTDIWDVDPLEATGGQAVELAWFSPDCRHFSKAKGSAPVSPKVRSLAWVVVRWARAVRPKVFMLENVEEFSTWGPLGADGRPCPLRQGLTFRRWWATLVKLGYHLEMRELRASDYGVPTSRNRLFIVGRCDGEPIAWPEPTHGPGTWRTAAECIQWEVPATSIFGRPKALAEATQQRIARGLGRYVFNHPDPFLAPIAMTGNDHRRLVAAFMAQHNTGMVGHDCREPVSTISSRGSQQQLVVADLGPGDSVRDPGVRAWLVKYYGTAVGQSLNDPLHVVTAKGRFGLVTVDGAYGDIRDIGMRMLTPRELFRAQGFPDAYEIDIQYEGGRMSKSAQIRLCGNSVCPPLAAQIVAANVKVSTQRLVA